MDEILLIAPVFSDELLESRASGSLSPANSRISLYVPYKNPTDLTRHSRRKSREAHHRKEQFVRDAKSKPCADCGGSFPYYVMQFDHRDPAAKFKGLAALAKHSASWRQIIDEIAKCDVVCANCHAIRSFEGKHWRSTGNRRDISAPQFALAL